MYLALGVGIEPQYPALQVLEPRQLPGTLTDQVLVPRYLSISIVSRRGDQIEQPVGMTLLQLPVSAERNFCNHPFLLYRFTNERFLLWLMLAGCTSSTFWESLASPCPENKMY